MTEDYSAHVIAARKALATAEAHAALHNWSDAQLYLFSVRASAEEAIDAIQAIKTAADKAEAV